MGGACAGSDSQVSHSGLLGLAPPLAPSSFPGGGNCDEAVERLALSPKEAGNSRAASRQAVPGDGFAGGGGAPLSDGGGASTSEGALGPVCVNVRAKRGSSRSGTLPPPAAPEVVPSPHRPPPLPHHPPWRRHLGYLQGSSLLPGPPETLRPTDSKRRRARPSPRHPPDFRIRVTSCSRSWPSPIRAWTKRRPGEEYVRKD